MVAKQIEHARFPFVNQTADDDNLPLSGSGHRATVVVWLTNRSAWNSAPCRNFSNFFLKTTRSVISVHILVLLSMRKYILNHK